MMRVGDGAGTIEMIDLTDSCRIEQVSGAWHVPTGNIAS